MCCFNVLPLHRLQCEADVWTTAELACAHTGSDADSRSRGLGMACMLVDQLWPQATAKPAAPGGRRSVTFASPAAPSAAASSAASPAQSDPTVWRSDALDRLAVALAEPDLLSVRHTQVWLGGAELDVPHVHPANSVASADDQLCGECLWVTAGQHQLSVIE